MMKKYAVNFEAGEGREISGGVNFMTCLDLPDLYAEIAAPEDASDDYGYMSLKAQILEQAQKLGVSARNLEFWYDGQEDKLATDAWAGAKTWWIVDQRRHEWFEENTHITNRNDAMSKALTAWSRLTEDEQRARDDFYLALAATDEDGCIDYNSIIETIQIKAK